MALPHEARRGRGVLLIALAACTWGTVGVTKEAISHLAAADSVTIGFFRLAIAAPALLAAAAAVLRRGLWRVAPRDAALMALIGVMLAGYQACYFTAIGYAGVTVATLVTLCTAPVLVALISAGLTRELPGWRVTVALAGALAGTAMLVGGPRDGAGGGALIAGVLFALGSALGYAVVAVCGRQLAGRASPLQINAIAFATGALALLLLTLPAGPTLAFPAAGWGLLLYLGLVPTALGYVLFLRGIRHTTATVASIVTLAEPLTATLLAWALFGERLGPLGIAGAALLVGSLLLAARE